MVSCDLFLDLAMDYAKQSTCLRRKYGCVIVDPRLNDPIAGGFNGAPCNMPHCTDSNVCIRQELKIKAGERYELCKSSHSEQNALIKAGSRAIGCDLYLYGWDVELDREIVPKPCFLCTKMMINAKINKVVTRNVIFDPVELYYSYIQELECSMNPRHPFNP